MKETMKTDSCEELRVEMKKEWMSPKIERICISRTLATVGSGSDASGSALP